jgi:hypothetical protein
VGSFFLSFLSFRPYRVVDRWCTCMPFLSPSIIVPSQLQKNEISFRGAKSELK